MGFFGSRWEEIVNSIMKKESSGEVELTVPLSFIRLYGDWLAELAVSLAESYGYEVYAVVDDADDVENTIEEVEGQIRVTANSPSLIATMLFGLLRDKGIVKFDSKTENGNNIFIYRFRTGENFDFEL
jgi:hypothetical protein